MTGARDSLWSDATFEPLSEIGIKATTSNEASMHMCVHAVLGFPVLNSYIHASLRRFLSPFLTVEF